jgi:hypothetical protein
MRTLSLRTRWSSTRTPTSTRCSWSRRRIRNGQRRPGPSRRSS